MGDLLSKLGRHNFRPNHLHMMIEAPGFHKLVTSLYPEGDVFLSSDPVFGVKKSLVVVSKRKCWLVVAFVCLLLYLLCELTSFSYRNSLRWMTR